MSDKIMVMRNGEVIETGTRDRILQRTDNEYIKRLLDAVPKLGGDRFV